MNPYHEERPAAAVGEANFESEVLHSSQPVLVVFGAPWSRPCHILEAALSEVAVDCAGRLKVVRVDADNNPDLSLLHDIQSVPTLLLFVKGRLRAKLVGTVSKSAILSRLESVLHHDESTPLMPHPDVKHDERNL